MRTKDRGSMLDPIKIEEELLDESTDFAGDNAGTNEAPSGWPLRGPGYAGPEPGNDSQPFGRTSRAISDALADIADGRSVGEYPAVDALIRRRPRAAGHGPQYESPTDDVCRPDTCQHRQRPEQGAYEGIAAAPHSRLISDIHQAPSGERLAKIEGQVELLVGQGRDTLAQISHAATKGALHEVDKRLDKRIDTVHVRITEEVLPVVRTLQKKRLLRDRLYPVWLTVATLGAGISIVVNILLITGKL